MIFRTSGAIAALLVGLAGASCQALAQYYPPPPQAYPPPPGYPPGYRPLAAGEGEGLPEPTVQSRPLPPLDVGTPVDEPPGTRFRGRAPIYDEAGLPPPPPVYRDAPYRDAPAAAPDAYPQPLHPPSYPQQAHPETLPPPTGQPYPQQAVPQQGYPQQAYPQPQQGYPQQAMPHQGLPPPAGYGDAAPPMPQGFEPAAAGSRPYYPGGAPAAAVEPDGIRPPLPIGPGQQYDNRWGARGDPRRRAASRGAARDRAA
jgi:hypothetical protein